VQVIKRIVLLVLLVVFAAAATAQSPQSPLSDTRISVNTLLREDIFSGFLADDMDRFARGEKNIQLLLEQRPNEKPLTLAWSALANVYRAVRANEANKPEEFQKYYRQSLDLFAQAEKLGPGNPGVAAIHGGTYLVLADRLPKEYRAAAWLQAYDSYRLLWKFQSGGVEQLPVHLKGELLAGLAQTAQRTGHKEEQAQYIDKMLAVLANTPYEPAAKQWKAHPESASNSSVACMTCHDAGRLAARVASLK
jgi:hypothetical protein